MGHGHKTGKPSPTYRIWLGMKRRCTDTKCKDYKKYGAKGITVCERWNGSFVNFLSDMGERPSLDHSIDRLDPSGDYRPDNCRWATSFQQGAENRRSLKPITIDGMSFHSFAAACRHFGVSRTTANMRMRAGHSPESACSTPTRGFPNIRTRESYLPKHKRP